MIKPQILFVDQSNLDKNEVNEIFSEFTVVENGSFIRSEYDPILITHIYVRFSISVDKFFLSKFPKLRCVVSPVTSVDQIDLKYLEQNKIKLISLKDGKKLVKSISSTTELATWFILEFARRPSAYMEHVRGGGWNRYLYENYSLKDKTLGIIGLGRIGNQVARIFSNLGMKIIYYDIKHKFSFKYRRVPNLNSIAQFSDFISLHATASDLNEGLIDKTFLMNLNPNGSYIVNTARGLLVNEQDILESLYSGKLLGYATDSLRGEYQSPDKFLSKNALWQASRENKNILISPHIGGSTIDSLVKVDRFCLRKAAKL
jgi:phosphoglycerate dehydrogenase-like enzyme